MTQQPKSLLEIEQEQMAALENTRRMILENELPALQEFIETIRKDASISEVVMVLERCIPVLNGFRKDQANYLLTAIKTVSEALLRETLAAEKRLNPAVESEAENT